MSELVRCSACGGAIVYDVRVAGAACLFCGSVALAAVAAEDPPPTPDLALAPAVDAATADARFRAGARRSWWYPTELRRAQLQMRAMSLPAWRFASHLETHGVGLSRAATRSGKRPESGLASVDRSVMVPASGGVSQAELSGLSPWNEEAAAAWSAERATLPWEPPQLTERAARIKAHGLLAGWHAGVIASAQGLLSCNVSPVIDDRDVKLLMLPIWIGAFRFRDRTWRFVVNAQTGEVVGKAPIDRVKVALVIGGAAFALSAIAALIALLS